MFSVGAHSLKRYFGVGETEDARDIRISVFEKKIQKHFDIKIKLKNVKLQ